jgi:hypothetical protein
VTAETERSQYREDLKIDKYDLDNELNEHSRLFEKWSNALAEAEYYRDKALRKLDAAKAQADYDIRTKPKDYGWDDTDRAPTEPFIKAAVPRHSAVKFAERDLSKCKLRVGKLKGAVRAFEHRKMGISETVRLWSKQYYARPYVSKETKEIKKEVQEKSAQAQEEALAKMED